MASINNMQGKIDPRLYYVMYNGITRYIEGKQTRYKTVLKLLDRDRKRENKREKDNKKATNARKRKRPVPKEEDIHDIAELIKEQHKIGWDNMLRGKISEGWRKIQRKYELQQKYIRNERRVRIKLAVGNVTIP